MKMWGKTYTQIAIIFAFIVILLHLIIFPDYTMPPLILLGGFLTIFLFFIGLWYYSKIWYDVAHIKRKLFIHCIIFRTLGVLMMYILTASFDPDNLPFEIGAIDSVNYHISGQLVAEALEKNESIFKALSGFWKGESDYGFSIIIGYLYYFFGSYTWIIKLFNIILGSFTVVRIYQIVRYIYSEQTARTAGILSMLMPPLLWFGAMLLKETFLIFILIQVAYLVVKMIYTKGIRFHLFFMLIPLIAITLYFRTFIAPLLLICILLQITFLRTQKKYYRILSVFISLLLIYGSYIAIDQLGMKENMDAIIAASQNQFENELTYSAQSRGITYTKAIIAPLLIAGAIVTPFPSLLNFELAQLGIYAHFHNELIRNILYFFVFLGLFRLFKHRKRGTIFIASFAVGYILILAISGISFQDRFQILALPFLIIFMADGITNPYPRQKKQWKIYLFFIAIAILAWNLFKLSNRGLL